MERVLNLSYCSPGRVAAADDGLPVGFETFRFPGGESHIKLSGALRGQHVKVVAHVRSGDDLMLLALAADAIRRSGGIPSAAIPYFPYARQDRCMVDGEPLSLKVAADFVNSMAFENVTVYDPHSDVTPALLNNCRVVTNASFIGRVMRHIGSESLCLVAPDAGAQKKQHKLCQSLHYTGPQVLCSKLRDVATGKILRQSFDGDPNGLDCLIVDDICDGGRTFIELSKELAAAGARRVFLAVSHGIFSQGEGPLKEVIDGAFCTDSYKTVESDYITQFSILGEL
jgi:ribose-phosphate pyrophosphokinase